MSLKKIIAASLLLAFSTIAMQSSAQRDTKDVNTKSAIAGKSYQAWTKGKFDNNPAADAAAYLVFDASSKGTCRQFFIYSPDLKSAETHELKATYIDISGRPALKFSHKDGTDAGAVYITSYNGGTKVWVEGTDANRPMKGWMLMVPSAPLK
jgi:hypothetical protein